MSADGWASVSIHAGPIRNTGTGSRSAGTLVSMGHAVHLNIKPEIAAQWVTVLTEIAEGNTSK